MWHKIDYYFIRSIKKLWYWFPIIWKDRDYDGNYVLIIMRHKLKSMIKHHTKTNRFINTMNDIKWMKICVKLIDNILNGFYWEDEYDGLKPSKNGFNSLQWSKSLDILDDIKYGSNKVYGDYWDHKSQQLLWKIIAWKNEFWWD